MGIMWFLCMFEPVISAVLSCMALSITEVIIAGASVLQKPDNPEKNTQSTAT